MAMTASAWLAAFAAELEVEAPDDDDVEALLALAGTAAHASERIAAPVACWLAARAGVTAAHARDVATLLAAKPPTDG